eukprot:6832164-Lingulodinium_polyedra.AAC.1
MMPRASRPMKRRFGRAPSGKAARMAAKMKPLVPAKNASASTRAPNWGQAATKGWERLCASGSRAARGPTPNFLRLHCN